MKIELTNTTYKTVLDVKRETEEVYDISFKDVDEFISYMTDTQHNQNERRY